MHCLRRIVVSKPVRVTSWTDDVDFGVLCFLTRYVSLRKALRAIQQDARRSRRSFAEVALATPTVTKQALAVQDLDNLGVNLRQGYSCLVPWRLKRSEHNASAPGLSRRGWRTCELNCVRGPCSVGVQPHGWRVARAGIDLAYCFVSCTIVRSGACCWTSSPASAPRATGR